MNHYVSSSFNTPKVFEIGAVLFVLQTISLLY